MTCRQVFAVATAAVVFCLTTTAYSQATPAAHRSGGEIRAGVAFSNANSDEVSKRIGGFSAFGSYNLFPHFALEGNVHLLQFFTPQDYAQRSYEGGARFYYRYRRYEPYVKFMGGIAQTVKQLSYVNDPGTPDSFGLYSGSIGVDVLMPKKFILRGEYEQQVWPSFPPNNLDPSIVSIGVAYRIR